MELIWGDSPNLIPPVSRTRKEVLLNGPIDNLVKKCEMFVEFTTVKPTELRPTWLQLQDFAQSHFPDFTVTIVGRTDSSNETGRGFSLVAVYTDKEGDPIRRRKSTRDQIFRLTDHALMCLDNIDIFEEDSQVAAFCLYF